MEEKPKTDMEKAEAVVASLKAENDRTLALVERQEKLRVADTLGGVTEAGQAPVVKADETAADYATSVAGGKYNGQKEE